MKLTSEESARLANAVAAAEERTSAEIVLAIAARSDDDVRILMAAAGIGFAVLAGLALFVPALSLRAAFVVSTSAALAAGLALLWTPLRMALVPAAMKRRAAARLARLQFLERVAGRTKAATGVLVFISLAEHYVEIIPDAGVSARIAPGAWQKVVAATITDVRTKGAVEAFAFAVTACADILAEVFPPQAGDINEIGDVPEIARPL